jgi:CBS domain-containing protein
MDFLEQKNFIKNIHPFDNLSNQELEEFCSSLDIVYFKKDTIIQNTSSKELFLFLIIKGSVKETNQNQIVYVYTKDEFFDPISLIENSVKNEFVTIEETICYSIQKENFLKFIYQNSTLESFFFQSISQKLNSNINKAKSSELVNFMIAKVKDAYYSKPTIIDYKTSIYNALSQMTQHKHSSILIEKNDQIGIVTNSDFIKKGILEKINFDDEIEKIATFNPIEIYEDDFLFNAQLKMYKYGVKKLIIKDKKDNITGILDLMSLTSFFASHTYSVITKIENAINLEELKNASFSFINVIKVLYTKGVKLRYISKLIYQLNTKLFKKLFELIAPQGLIEQSCLIVMGSEGRGEQILKTDQDNALIINDNCSIENDTIEKFSNDFNHYLEEFGYPLCDGNIMINNPSWRMSISNFKNKIESWLEQGTNDNLMNLAIFYDSSFVCGDITLLNELKEFTITNSKQIPSFYSFFAKPILNFDTPLNIFANFVVDKNEHKDELDIKKGGIFPIVQGIRALSFENNISQTNTVERIKELNNLNIIDREFSSELIEAFNFFLTIRLKFRLEKIELKQKPDNYINPSKLNTLEKDLLKDSFKIVDKFKKFISYHYKLNIFG